MAMGLVKGQAATLQVEMVCLDELVSEDDRYRKLDRLVDWSFVREVARSYYARDVGTAVDRPDRAGEADGCGRAGGDRLDAGAVAAGECAPRFAPLPRLRTLRAAAGAPDALARAHAPLRRCGAVRAPVSALARAVQAARLVEGTHLSIDGFHAEADAALASLRASLAPAPAAEAGADDDAEPSEGGAPAPDGQPGGERPALVLAEPRSGPTPKRRSSNQTSVSRTDPEAKLRGKPGQRPHLVYRGQVAVDRKQRVIVACRGEQADGFEGDAVEPLLDRARFACPELASVALGNRPSGQSVSSVPSPRSRRAPRTYRCQWSARARV